MGSEPTSFTTFTSHTFIIMEQKQEEETPLTQMQALLYGAASLALAVFTWLFSAWALTRNERRSPLEFKHLLGPLLSFTCCCSKVFKAKEGELDTIKGDGTWKSLQRTCWGISVLIYILLGCTGLFIFTALTGSSEGEESENKDVEAGKSPEV